MIQDINEYLDQLEKEVAGSDSTTIQDTLSDAEEHLRTALNSTLESKPGVPETDVLETGPLQLADLAPRIKDLRQRQEQLQISRYELEMLLSDRRVELADLETVTQYMADLHNLLNDSTLAEKKSFIRSFISEVRGTGTGVLLAYNLPAFESKLVSETCVVPLIVHYGGEGGTRTPTHYCTRS